nr:EOG090X0784 [Simocephalus serrulatus]
MIKIMGMHKKEKGTCPLHVAAGAGQASQVELLLIYGADPGGSDSFGKSPSDHASDAGYKDIAHRLVESQYELTNRISFYLCERKPDHASGQHFLIPEIADSIDSNSEVAKAAKRKLQMLPNYLFEEMAMDVYDEVDRRETEQYWISLQGPGSQQTADRGHSVPFLPVNAELSTTRNQARQKLGRLNAREFATLLIDLLSEAKRRQQGGMVFSLKDLQHNMKPDCSDDEPLYDSVASEEEFVLAEQQQILAEQKLENNKALREDESTQLDKVTMEEYFDSNVDLGKRDIGRPKEMTTKVQKFKATLWLCEEFPLSLVDQIMPIVDLMAISSTHFAKLRDFIQMQLPAGFPTKIEIPLFHVMNACITFGNTFALDEPVHGVSVVQEDDRLSCIVDDTCFVTPGDYTVYGMGGASASSRRQFSMDEEDELLQYAIQQSLLDVGSEGDQVDIWEALKGQKPNTPQPSRVHRSPLPPRASSSLGFSLSAEEEQLQRAIEASLGMPVPFTEVDLNAVDTPSAGTSEVEEEAALLAEALVVSARETALEEERRSKEDAELLQRILELSLLEK